MPEVARRPTTLVRMEDGRYTRAGPAPDLHSHPAAAPALGLREAGAILPARLAAQEEDGLSRLDTGAGPLLLPRVDAPIGSDLRLRILAQDVMLATRRPDGISALNILPAVVRDIREGGGPGALIRLTAGSETLLARITRRSAAALGLAPGREVYAVLKAVSVAQENVGGLGQRQATVKD
jgi:molybdate transport system ATP-binding protein